MKRKVLILSAFILSIGSMFAQGELDAYKLSQTDLVGTARSVSLGGAMGAMGGDISAVSINPAGIGIYKSSEVVTTLNFQNTQTKIESNLGKFDESKFKVNFDNLAFVSVFPLNSDVAPFLNFGFSYNRLKNYDRTYSMDMANPSNLTLAHYMANRANNINFFDKNPQNELRFKDDSDIYPLQNYDWMAVIGANADLMGYDPTKGFFVSPSNTDANLYVREKGSANTYDFNVGTTFSNIVSVGLTLSVTDMKYRLYSELTENYSDTYYTLANDIETEGAGFQVGLGVLVSPIKQLRLGVAYHSPTWYNMTDYYSAGYSPANPQDGFETGRFRSDYRLRTPDKWTFSLAAFVLDPGDGLFPKISISGDYMLTNYNNMKLFDDNGDELSHRPNEVIKEDFKMASTLRTGLEVRFTNQFSARVGYSWQQSPLKKEFKNNEVEALTIGSVSHFTLDGDTNYFTYGLGYRFSRSFYADVAFAMRTQKSELRTFSSYTDAKTKQYVSSEKAEWKDNTFQGILTLGYKF